eukprot:scaffold10187_cov195-Cylindrotheca_fusiformis.AAC.6
MNSDKKRDIRSAEKSRDGEDTASMDDMGTFLGSLTQASGELSSPPRTKRLDDRRFLDSPARNTRSTKKSPTRQPVISTVDQPLEQDTASIADKADILSSNSSMGTTSSLMLNIACENDSQSSSKTFRGSKGFQLNGLKTRTAARSQLVDSPARNTRSAKKEKMPMDEEDADSIADIANILGGPRPMAGDESPVIADQFSPVDDRDRTGESEETASIGDIGDILSSLSQSPGGGSSSLGGQVEVKGSRGSTNFDTSSVLEKSCTPQRQAKVIFRPNEVDSPILHVSDSARAKSSPTVENGGDCEMKPGSGDTHIIGHRTAQSLSGSGNRSKDTQVVGTGSSLRTLKTNTFTENPSSNQDEILTENRKTSKSVLPDEELVISKVDTSAEDTASIADIADILGTGTPIHDVETSPLRDSPPFAVYNSSQMEGSVGSEQKSSLSQMDSRVKESASRTDVGHLLEAPYPRHLNERMDEQLSLQEGLLGQSPLSHGSGDESSFERNGGTNAQRSERIRCASVSKACTTPEKGSFSKSPMRLTPNSHVKPTPTRLQPSPMRVPNPMAMSSPARSLRSTKKTKMGSVGTSGQKRLRNVESSKPSSYSEVDVLRDGCSDRGLKKRLRLSPEVLNKENGSLQSPMPKKYQPIGILSSKKRARIKRDTYSQRSVAFGSPEAALYHVGSPSGNFTPLPRSRAKELFSMPPRNIAATDSKLNSSGDETIEIESDLNILVDKISVKNMKESPALSPIANDKDGSRIDERSDLSMAESEDSASSDALMPREGKSLRNEQTVELEGGIDHLLANAMPSSRNMPSSRALGESVGRHGKGVSAAEELSPADSSVDMTDNQSIASINSRAEKYTAELNMPPMDAQKLDFSFQSANRENSETESMDIDEGNTVELEGDITSLLAAAGLQGSGLQPPTEAHKNEESISQDDSSGLSEDLGTPIASIRFSMSPGKVLRPSAVDNLLVNYKNEEISLADTEHRPEDTYARKSIDIQEEPLTLSLDEIRANFGVATERYLDQSDTRKHDSLTSFSKSLQSTDSITFERWNQFLQAVCGEVEKQQTDLDGKAESDFLSLVEAQPRWLLKLQTKLRSTEGTELQEDIHTMLQVGKERLESEWQSWLAVVLESFMNPLSAVSSALSKEKEKLDVASKKYDEFYTKLSFMAGRKVQRARRKSLSRRKVSQLRIQSGDTGSFLRLAVLIMYPQSVASALESEIKAIELQIAQTQASVNELKGQESEAEKNRLDLQEIATLVNERKTLASKAAPIQKAYLSLKGLHSWSPVSVGESKLSFKCTGQSLLTSNTILFELSKSGIAAKVSSNELAVAAYMQRRPKSSPSVASFVAFCVEKHTQAVEMQSLSCASQIGDNMMEYMWMMGRLDQAAKEMQSLRRRYKTKFVQKGESYVFSVEFRNQSTKLIVDFEIDHHYPSLPLEVRLDLMEGALDLASIRRALQKNSKPGFGNLSRACGIVSAFILQ